MPRKINDEFKNVNVTKVAALCGVTERTIQNLFKHSGAEGKIGRGKYDLNIFMPWYIEFIRAGQPSNDVSSAKDRKESAMAILKEIEVLNAQKKLVPYDLSERILTEEMRLIKENIYGVPNKVAIKMLRAQTKEEVKAILKTEIDNAFRKYSDIDYRVSATRKTNNRTAAKVKKKTPAIIKAKAKPKRKRVGKKV